MSDDDYRVVFGALLDWNERAMARGGTTTETVARVNSSIVNVCRRHPESLISGAPNRVPGTVIWWTAEVDHERRIIRIIHIEPDPHPGL